MEVYCKFKSAKDYDSIPIDWHYTTVSDLKDYVLKKKCSGKRNKNHYDILTLTNADTNEEYLDGETLIPKNTFLIIRRAPRCFRMPIVINPPVTLEQEDNPLVEKKLKEDNCFEEPSTSVYPRESEWVEFWNDLSPSEAVVPVQDAPPSKADEDSKTRDPIKTSAMNWGQCHNPTDRFGRGDMGGRSGGCRFGRGGLSVRITPSPGYICHRCKVPGHFIQHCPTNGDCAYDIKRNQPPSGIPNSMLMASPDGSAAVLPAELHCPLCKAVMKDAVLAGKCCFESFCDKCIRDYIMSNSLCTCGATNVLVDDFIPNRTVRDTIVRMSESIISSGANRGSTFQPRDMESAPCPQAKITCSKVPSPTLSAPSKVVVHAPKSEGNTEVKAITEAIVDNVAQETLGKVIAGQGGEVSEAVHECAREPGSQIYPPVTDGEMQQKPISGNVEKQKKKRADMHLRRHQDLYYNPMQFNEFGQPYCGQMPFMGYGLGPTTISFGAAFHHNPYGAQSYMMPVPPQRDLAKFGTGFNGGCGGFPVMSTGENDTWDTTKKQTRDDEKSGGSMKVPRDRNFNRDMIRNEDVTSMKSDLEPSPELTCTSSKRKVKHDDDDKEGFKKRKLGNSSPAVNGWIHHSYAVDDIYEWSDDDRHFKRRPSRYESSPSPAMVKGRHSSRGWRVKGVTAARISRLSVY